MWVQFPSQAPFYARVVQRQNTNSKPNRYLNCREYDCKQRNLGQIFLKDLSPKAFGGPSGYDGSPFCTHTTM